MREMRAHETERKLSRRNIDRSSINGIFKILTLHDCKFILNFLHFLQLSLSLSLLLFPSFFLTNKRDPSSSGSFDLSSADSRSFAVSTIMY